MYAIRARNVNEALPAGVDLLNRQGVEQSTRAGKVLVFREPVTTYIQRPTERVIGFKERKANHVFHLMESLWMLAGRQDVAWLTQFNPKMADFSDNGVTFNAPYGYRWRAHFGHDQLDLVVRLLRNHPNTRRAVLQIWDVERDLHPTEQITKDVACNTQAYFWLTDSHLNMTVTNRSNDIIWGLYGTNCVHFSILQEYLAARVGVAVGGYWHVSNNFHAYVDVLKKYPMLAIHAPDPFRLIPRDWYAQGVVQPFPLVSKADVWDQELEQFMADPGSDFQEPFFQRVAKPVYWTWKLLKQKDEKDRFKLARKVMNSCLATDWKAGVEHQIDRMEQKAQKT